MAAPRPCIEPRYPWPALPVVVRCDRCGREIVVTRSFGRDVKLQPTPRRDGHMPYGIEHERFDRCAPPSPF